MKICEPLSKTADYFSALANPFRLQILLVIGAGEVCVCHLECVLKKRQAYISQHLMALREAGILETQREGKYIFYRVAEKNTLRLIREVAALAGIESTEMLKNNQHAIIKSCGCPHCKPDK